MYLRLKIKGLIVSLSSFSVYYHYNGMMVFEKVVMYGKVSKMLTEGISLQRGSPFSLYKRNHKSYTEME